MRACGDVMDFLACVCVLKRGAFRCISIVIGDLGGMCMSYKRDRYSGAECTDWLP